MQLKGRGRIRGLAVALAATAVGVVTQQPSSAADSTFSGSVDSQGTASVVVALKITDAGPVSARLSWMGATTNLNLFVKSPSGTALASSTSKTADPEVVGFTAATPGTYKFTVKAVTGGASFTLALSYPGSVAPVAPTQAGQLGGGETGHAQFYASGLDVDAAGNFFLADTGDDQIEKYTADGRLVWVVGTTGGKAPGRFDNPRDVAHLDGKVYVADTGYKRVQVLDAIDPHSSTPVVWTYPFGTIMGISSGRDALGAPIILVAEASSSTVKVFTPAGAYVRTIGLGAGAGADGHMADVRDADTDSVGNVYVADYQNDRIAKFAPDGTFLFDFGVRGTGIDQLKRPYGVDIDDLDNVYVADGNDEIDKYDAAGRLLMNYGSRGTGPGQFTILRRAAVSSGPHPRVCGADLWTYKITCFAQDGSPALAIVGTPPATAFFNEPYGFAVDASQMYVMDTTNQRMQVFDTATDAFQFSFGERGWGEGNAGFNWARDVTMVGGPTGTLWVADTKNSRLTEFNRDGTATGRVLGSPGNGPSQLNWPYAVSTWSGDVIVADSKNNRVSRWTPGTPAPTWTATGFKNPKDVTVVGDTVYVADSENHRIVALSALTGQVTVPSIGAGVLHSLEGLAVARNGDFWVSDTSFNRVVQLSSTGDLKQVLGGPGTAAGRFDVPGHLEILPGVAGAKDRLYVADMQNDRVQIFTLD